MDAMGGRGPGTVFALSILHAGMIGWIMRKKGIVQDGNLKIDLG